MTLNKGPVLGARHLQTFLLFCAILVSYVCRHNIAVSLVAMTDKTTTNPNFPEFNWNEKQKSYIMSSFFWGYVISQVPGGYAARRFGTRKTLFCGFFINSVLGFSVPFLISWGDWPAFCAIRAVQGLSEGTLFPCIYQHLANWCPLNERNWLGSLSYKGSECGIILAMFVTGMIASSDWGWPGISYVFGGCGMIFSLIWIMLAENTPEKAKFITSEERNYIIFSREDHESLDQKKEKKKNIPIPWKAIFTSWPFLSLIVIRCCESWAFTTFLTQIPFYLHGALKMDITSNAFYSALPYLGMMVFSWLFTILADVLLKNSWLSLLAIRKTFSSIALWGGAVIFIILGFVNENQNTLAIACFTLAVSLGSGAIIGNLMNVIDLAPSHSGILMALANTFAQMVAVLCPVVVGIIVTDETDRMQWQIVFFIAAGLLIIGNLQFIFFAQTDTQPWNDDNYMIRPENGRSTKMTTVSSK